MTLGSLHMALRGAGLTVITMGSHVLNLHVSVYDGRMHSRKKRKKRQRRRGRKKKRRKKKGGKKRKKEKKGDDWKLGFGSFTSLPAI